MNTMRQTNRTRVVLAILLWISVSSVASGKDKWIRLVSPNFEAVSNAGQGRSERLIRELEQFRHVFSELFNLAGDRLPVTVVIFRNDKSFTPFKPLYEGHPTDVAGFFQAGEDRNLIALNASASGNPLHVIFHEYIHLLTRDTPHPWPVWLREGLAEFYATFEIQDTKVILGNAIPGHSDVLRNHQLLPVKDLFAVRQDSPTYNERKRQGIFYAQSWALTHYLMLHNKAQLQPQFVKFIEGLWQGVDPEKAFSAAVDLSLEELEKELVRYTRKNVLYAAVVRLPTIPAAQSIEVGELSPGQAQIQLGYLLYSADRLEEATLRFKEARRLEPESIPAVEGLALTALRQRDREGARGYLEEVVERGSSNHLIHYYLGEMLLDEFESDANISQEVYQRIATPLRRAIELEPTFPKPFYLLARLHRAWGQELGVGLKAISQAIRLRPQNEYYKVARASLLLEKQDFETAQPILLQLLESSELDVQSYAASSLENIRSMQEQVRQQPAGSPIRREGEADLTVLEQDRPTLARKLKPSEPATDAFGLPAPAGVPERQCRPAFADVRSTAPVTGRLLRVECLQTGIVYVVEIGGREVRTIGLDPTGPVLFSCQTRAEEMRCGDFERNARIYFSPSSEIDPESGASRVLAIEFY